MKFSELRFEMSEWGVGYPKKKESLELGGIWGLIDGKQKQIRLGDAKNKDQKSFFTGDYDMHDLLKKNQRILAGTPEEASTIHNLLVQMDGQAVKVNSKDKLTIKNKQAVPGRWFNSQYAWIRHGAQTSFISYLLLGKSSDELKKISSQFLAPPPLLEVLVGLPLQGKVTTIDDDIVMFDEKGKAYRLKGVERVYSYYKAKDLLDQIPFYFFFADLIKKDKATVAKYADEINKLLRN